MISFREFFGDKVLFPINPLNSGHIALQFFTSSKEDGNKASSLIFEESKSPKSMISYVQQAKRPKIETIMLNDHLDKEKFYKKKGFKKKEDSPLSKAQVFKLHHFFGHCRADILRDKIKKAGKWDQSVEKYLLEVEKCEVCMVEARRTPRPKVTRIECQLHFRISGLVQISFSPPEFFKSGLVQT